MRGVWMLYSGSDTMSVIINEGAPKEFTDLPIEVVSKILSWLPHCDLKSSRLVSKQWYEASLAFRIRDAEIIRYPCINYCREAFAKSSRDFLHVQVVGGCKNKRLWYRDSFWVKVQPTIRSLQFVYVSISEKHLFNLLKDCPMLSTLKFECCEISHRGPSYLSSLKLSRLKNLDITCEAWDEINIILSIAECAPNLQLLRLETMMALCKNSTFSLVHRAEEFLRAHKNRNLNLRLECHRERLRVAFELASSGNAVEFKRLIMHGIINNWNPHLFDRCSSLQHLYIVNFVTDEALNVICSEIGTLKMLSLLNCSKVVNGLEKLTLLRNLETLVLEDCLKVSEESILKGLCSRVDKKLKSLTCSKLNIPDSCFVELARCHPSVTELDIRSCSIGYDGVKAISVFQPFVEILRLSYCKQIGDEILTPLSSLKGLKVLNLYHTNIRGNPFGEGLTMPALDALDLALTRVTVKSVRSVIQNHHTLRILWCYSRACRVRRSHVQDLLASRPQLQYYAW